MALSVGLLRGCSALALVVAVSPSVAQAQTGDVIMRRPLPFYVHKKPGAEPTPTPKATSIPDDVTPTPTPEPSTPTPTPTIPTPTPSTPTPDPVSPTPDPGPTSNPDGTTPTPSPVFPTPTPNPTVISGGDGCDLFGVCPTPTSPTPTPADDGGTPTPTPVPTPTSGQDGFTFDPDIVTPVYGGGYGVAQWTYGEWQGAGQCGQRSHLTRELGCQVVGPPVEVIGRNDGVPSFGRPETQLASYAPGKAPVAAPAIFDPSSSDVKAHLAQYGGGGGDMKVTTVPIETCMEQLGPPPPNTYDGDQAGCEYEPVDEGYSEWTLGDFGQGTATCSAQAYRTPHFSCRAPDGSPADMQYCVENAREGGTRNSYMVDAQYGNYSGCKTGWVGEADDNLCFKPDTDWEKGTDRYAYYTYHCARSNGDILTGPDEAGCTGPKPSDGYKVVGSCTKVFYFGPSGQTCMAGYAGENVLGILNIEGNDIYNSKKGSDFCTGLGATCCAQRMVNNSNYSKAPYGTTQIIATRTDYVSTYGWHFDEGAFRIRSDEEGPYFYDYGGYEDYVTDPTYDFHIDDPDNVLDGGYLNHPNNGGGGEN